MNKYNFSLIGGDKRNINLIKLLEESGHNLKIYGFSKYREEKINNSKNLQEALKGSKYVITGIPFTSDGSTIIAPFSEQDIKIKALIKYLNKDQVLIGGFFSEDVINMATEKGIKIIDILKREQTINLNAIPTAEGTIKIAIEETDITLNGSNIMVIGHGRIGKIICRILSSMGANLFVVVRKKEYLAELKSYNYNGVMIKDINRKLNKMHIIINTVPNRVLHYKNMKYIDENCLVIDISSPPFGVDYEASKFYGIKALWARSLPGIIAPKTVAKYLRDSIYDIIKEL